MTAHLSEDLSDRIRQAEGLYHRLVLVVGPPGAGKTGVLRAVAERTGAPIVNVNRELSRHLLDLAERQRPLHVQLLLRQIVTETGGDLVLLDNLELLFDVALHQDPLRLLRGLSRSRTVVAAWNGRIEDGGVRYAAPGHPEHRRYPVDGILTVSAGAAA